MVSLLTSRQLPSFFAAALLCVLGVMGMRQEQSPLLQASEWVGVDEGSSPLLKREAVLNQRREVEELLMAFTRAQMTRHYWGSFAPTLNEMGLSVSDQLEPKVTTSNTEALLWLSSRQVDEAYLAVVRRKNVRLMRSQCRGSKSQAGKSFEGVCPPGWIQLSLDEAD